MDVGDLCIQKYPYLDNSEVLLICGIEYRFKEYAQSEHERYMYWLWFHDNTGGWQNEYLPFLEKFKV